MTCYYLTTPEIRARHGFVPATVGVTDTATGDIRVRRNGLHAAATVVEAIRLCPGFTLLCLVRLSGDVDYSDDGTEAAGRHRTILAVADVTEAWEALSVAFGVPGPVPGGETVEPCAFLRVAYAMSRAPERRAEVEAFLRLWLYFGGVSRIR